MSPNKNAPAGQGMGRQGETADAGNFKANNTLLVTGRVIDPACTCRLGLPCRTCLGWHAKILRVERRRAAITGWGAPI